MFYTMSSGRVLKHCEQIQDRPLRERRPLWCIATASNLPCSALLYHLGRSYSAILKVAVQTCTIWKICISWLCGPFYWAVIIAPANGCSCCALWGNKLHSAQCTLPKSFPLSPILRPCLPPPTLLRAAVTRQTKQRSIGQCRKVLWSIAQLGEAIEAAWKGSIEWRTLLHWQLRCLTSWSMMIKTILKPVINVNWY